MRTVALLIGLAVTSWAHAGGQFCSTQVCNAPSDCEDRFPHGCYVQSCDGNCCGGILRAGAKQCAGTCCAPTHGSCGTTCKLACTANYGDCDHDAETGCETYLPSSPTNCGACGKACTPPANASATCTNGACGFVCKAGFVLCGGECKACCGDKDCKSPPDKCHVGRCSSFQCVYDAKSCVVKDCYSQPSCDPDSGECVSTPLTGGECGKSGCYDHAGTCTNGVCKGATAMDCQSALPACTVGACDADTGSCTAEVVKDGVACVTEDKCQLTASCHSGVCYGTPKSCPAPAQCMTAACDPTSGDCKTTPAPAGTPCSSSGCQQNEACDGNGACTGALLPDGTPCSPSGDCADGASGHCQAGACFCGVIDGGGLVIPVDLGAPDAGIVPPSPADGCNASGSPPTLGLAVVLALWARRRRLRAGRARP